MLLALLGSMKSGNGVPPGFEGYSIPTAMGFDGGQYLEYATDTDFELGTGDFEIDAFVRADSLAGRYPRLFSIGSYTGGDSFAVSIEGGTVFFWANGSVMIASVGNDFTYGVFNHILYGRKNNQIYSKQ